MRKNSFVCLVLAVVCGPYFSWAQKEITAADIQSRPHPRLLLFAGEENRLRQTAARIPEWDRMHKAIFAACDAWLATPPVERIQIGRRLLDKSRECLRRVFYLAFAFRLTGDAKYAARAEKEMLAAAAFRDWNPSHFLDVAEMTMALAIGYDWLFDQLSPEARATIREAIVAKGLLPSMEKKNNAFLKADTNWNQVCNAGMTYGALAVAEDAPDLATRIIIRALESIRIPMKAYGPDGAYPEGYGYWGYGTEFNVMFLSATEKIFGTDFGLSATPGFMATARFLQHMTGVTGQAFNWSDSGTGGGLNPSMFWFAQKGEDPSLLWVEKGHLRADTYTKFTGHRLLPAMLIWSGDMPLADIQPPTAKAWMGQGLNPVCMLRTSHTDPNAIFLGFKAGSPSVNHGHMDVGSFVMEADGVRWAVDLGAQSYESLESKGMQIFGRTQAAQRWTVFRMNNFSHSTLTVDGQHQAVKGYARINAFADNPGFSFAISDLSAVYTQQLAAVQRGVALVNDAYVVVRDELTAGDHNAVVRWAMLTPAKVTLEERGATLTQSGQKLLLRVASPAEVKMSTWSTAPTNAYDAPNPGTILVGFEYTVPAHASAHLEVRLIPGKTGGTPPPETTKALQAWR